MNMLAGMLGGMFNKEQATKETIQDALEKFSKEAGLKFTDVFITIRPIDQEFNHRYYLCTYDEKGNPKMLRELTLKEILDSSEG